jgi:hypothetical protein
MQKEVKRMPKRIRTETKREPIVNTNVDVLATLAERYPRTVDGYAIHMWYLSHGHNPRFRVHETRVWDEENCDLYVDDKLAKINIRTGSINEIKLMPEVANMEEN